jgi:hypothetical protein
MQLANCLVALSNFIAIPLIYYNQTTYPILFPAMASFFYHLAEVKHNLPGINPFNKYANKLLWIDRFFAVLSFIYILIKIINNPLLITSSLLMIGLIAISSLLYSEHDIAVKLINPEYTIKTINFVIAHSIWHFTAFYCLATIMKN